MSKTKTVDYDRLIKEIYEIDDIIKTPYKIYVRLADVIEIIERAESEGNNEKS